MPFSHHLNCSPELSGAAAPSRTAESPGQHPHFPMRLPAKMETIPMPSVRRALTLLCRPRPANRLLLTGRLLSNGRLTIAAAVLLLGVPTSLSAYSPTDPVVQQMVSRGIQYLESLPPSAAYQGSYSEPGAASLIAYAHYKVEADRANPVVKRGVDAAVNFLGKLESSSIGTESKAVYEVAVAALLLAEVDPIAYKPQLQRAQNLLFSEQFSHGGWGYKGERHGDVSQTQYALLALWTLDHVGIPLDFERVKRSVEWLLRVQDVGGGWPYHGQDPGPGSPLRTQQMVSMSMALAGASSILIAGDALRAWGDTKQGGDPKIEGLPKALVLFQEESTRRRPQMAKDSILRGIARCEQYRSQNPYRRAAGLDWYHYQLYTLERYESFLEIATGKVDKSPSWYNQGVEELRADQDPETGGWGVKHRSHTAPSVSTSFAILFLIRSTQKAIDTISRGTLAGGQGLPSDTTDIRVDGTQIKGRPVAEAVTDLLQILEEDGADRLDGKSLPEDLRLAANPAERAAQLDRLERLVRGSQSWQARRVAARVLGSSDEIRVVPALIFALGDPDTTVRRYARDGLRFISRKFDGYGMSDKPTPDEVRKAQIAWRKWYRTIDPTHVFIDYDL